MKFLLIIIAIVISHVGNAQVPVYGKFAGGTPPPPYIPPVVTTGNGAFSFTLDTSSSTSAGVFKEDSILVRMLWSNVRYTSGTHTEYWDGKDDAGLIVGGVDSFKIKILSNNVQYEWQGAFIGNSSDSATGINKLRSKYNCMSGMAIANNGYAYFCSGYSEGPPSIGKILLSAPQAKYNLISNPGGTLNTEFVATDGVNVYWAGFDSYANTNSMVHATRVSDDANITFSTGAYYYVNHGLPIQSAISIVNAANAHITGLAVQKTGNFLFVTRAGLNQLQVINKTTGFLQQIFSYTSPRTICVDNDNNLWMVSGTNTVSKYALDNDGVLGPAIITLSGIIDPLSIQVSADGTLIAVADGGNSQQVKFFNNSTGSLTNTLGDANGYFTDAAVTNTKFYFSDVQGYDVKFRPVFIAFQSNGSFWVGDGGNSRVQHYSSSRTYIERILSIGISYVVYVDPNNPTRLWVGPLEFAIDYNVPLSGTTGWTLVKNWGPNITSAYYTDGTSSFTHPTTFSNGRTYAFIRKLAGNSIREYVEFPSTGQVRFTGITQSGPRIIAPDGAIQTITKGGLGGISTIYRYALTGFDGSNNPVWNTTPEILATTPVLTINDPNDILTGNTITSTNKVVIWNPDRELNAARAYKGDHLGAIQRGNNNWLWKTEKATRISYKGPYPGVGFFDIGNGVHNNAGGTLSILGRNLVTSYHGEFWKNSQTNTYNYYLDNGLAVGQFGVAGNNVSGVAPAMFAGNALTPMIVPDLNDSTSFYLYHGDASQHAGVHRWKIKRLYTIQVQSVTIAYPTLYTTPVLNYVDLMAGLPIDSSLVNGTAGWTRSPATDYTNSTSDRFSVVTSTQSYKKDENDVTVSFQSATIRTNTVSRDLGTNNVTNNWKISGELVYPAGNNANGQFAQQFLDVLDTAGKILTRFYIAATSTTTSIYGNTSVIASAAGTTTIQKAAAKPTAFSIELVDGAVTFTYGNYTPVTTTIFNATGSWATPKTLQISMVRNSLSTPARFMTMTVKDFQFRKDY